MKIQIRGGNNISRNIDDTTLIDDIFIKRDENSSEAYLKWGSDNKLPYRILKLVLDNPILLPLINFKVDIAIGQGLKTYKKDNEGNLIQKDFAEFQEFEAHNNIEDTLEMLFADYYMLGNAFPELIKTKIGDKIATLNAVDASTVRFKFAKIGTEPNSFVINPDYNNYKVIYNNEIAKFDPNKTAKKTIYHIKNYFPASSDMGVASWLGSSEFIEYLNMIPRFKKNMLSNIITPSFHVKIPADYFAVNFPNHTPEQIKAERDNLRDDLENFLQGVDNAGKILITYIWKDLQGRDMSIDVQAIKLEIGDNLFSSDFEQLFQIGCSAMQVPPSIASLLIPGKLSSGSDILNSYNAYLARIQRHRKKIIKVFEIIKTKNNWAKEMIFGFEDYELKQLQEKKTGIEQIINPL